MNTEAIGQAIRRYETPFYIFDTDMASGQVQKIRAALGAEVELCYAMKANPFLIGDLQDVVDGLEVCSPGEFHICERAGVDIGRVVLSGVYKNPADVEYAMERYGSRILYTAESLSQWRMLEQYAGKYRLPIRVLLRLTTGNQFGMDETAVRRIIADRDKNSLIRIEGIQYFPGTQKKAAGKFERELGMLDDFCSDLHRQYGFDVKKLEYGPGLPICYFDGEENVEDAMLDALARQIGKMKFGGKIALETGRFIAAPGGFYVTGVVDRKRNKNQLYCIVDGGIHHLNYFGQMMAMKKPPIVHWKEKAGEPEEWTVCGSLCTMNDVLVKQYPFTDLQVGDKLIFEKAGAYSVTEGISLFLSRRLPQVILYSGHGGFRLARRSIPTDTLNYIQK